jgi:meiosis-specific protein HOP1
MAQAVIVHLPQMAQQQAMHQDQSLQLVQTLLGASLGSLAWIRGLFPDYCFATLRYIPEYARDYHAFSTAEPTERREAGTVKVTRLKKGTSTVCDRLLDYLENGVFHALGNGYLKAMQLGIYADEEKPDVVVESYTFTFSYRDEDNLAVNVKRNSGGQATKQVTFGDSTPVTMVQQVTRTLISTTQNLHPLPGMWSQTLYSCLPLTSRR